MKPYQAKLHEAHGRHLLPPVVVGIADHEARQGKEEIDSQVCVVQQVFVVVEAQGDTYDVEQDNENRCAAPKAIEHSKWALPVAVVSV